jgi:hypothetical protein
MGCNACPGLTKRKTGKYIYLVLIDITTNTCYAPRSETRAPIVFGLLQPSNYDALDLLTMGL